MTKIGLILVTLFILAGLFAPFLITHDPKSTDISHRFSPPSHTHWLGQDKLGGDIYSKIIYGARISLTVAIVSTLLSFFIGLLLGSLAGYYGGWWDECLMRLVDILLAFPGLLLIFALAAFLSPSLLNVIMLFSIVGWTGFARVTRAQVLSEKEKEFVQAVRSLGANHSRILIRHIWPNILSPLIVQASFVMGGIIIGESSLSFLGVGVPPDIPSWGNMLSLAKQSSFQPGFIAIFPGIAIMLTVLGFNFIGDGLRDLWDPKLKK
ncbi:MAG: peptide ABC transporter permease [Deltaproteobacteria bacterium GWA2_38_16]|nr:MAG: peptide ABC transporter permease [Deltaproteobacteria bacterium GWA2_38_16]OGQ01709.1 MAG: peptide ABC transporter permease [Deltaproteobacteria bacterium RIFCSPHIGHO2_02_FULL_38_15]OGQ34830.1 MAG: peptide ABC transporter permease [Deltaproteobacteria bacterium RIFCSPLOWO2_01_FULL_38_9]OGQ61217.1 MAG: peptide ABC transporter permease [Deltaproteobacteria bacterium RIFCSPLOWO2_12_FULL_38_8]HBQ21805.1 peptide ABC transporter permease [Deltaproteobacteria bacterium]